MANDNDEELFIRMLLLVQRLLSQTRQQVVYLEHLSNQLKEMESRCRMQREQTSEQPSIPLPLAQQNTQEEETVPAVPKAMPTGAKPQVETVSDSGDNIETVSRETHKRKRTEDSSSHALPLPEQRKPRLAYLNLSEG